MGCIGISSYLPGGSGCHTVVWTASFCISVSGMMTTACLLCQAYHVNRRDRRILYASGPLTLLSCITWLTVWIDSQITNSDDIGCTIHYPQYLPYLRGAVDIFVNSMLSIAFLRIVHPCEAFGDSTQIVFLVEWIVASALLIRQHERMRAIGRGMSANRSAGKASSTDTHPTSTPAAPVMRVAPSGLGRTAPQF
ncbi:hypothetical protein THASP1DRAFT_25876 [Thamnocephalis sphaerospora]|uniref:Uncharacterized protein n=1 Tax=Thamnocephalis sphaerospora TaxID=78915 RepID=A0A4P9XK97_9FUNG|nr:hypothetical protein THASP1DRAFT_25876 [Thamnocephalis sphaerospora]|eukprot:RKP05660.1 hypothetical protein THASP1DRAFT_25876 [Thamnocephalis sphaerospora]